MSDDKKDDIAFQGWLSKQGGFQGGWENWKRRWIVVRVWGLNDCLYLFFFFL
jgi:hypothetical protein